MRDQGCGHFLWPLTVTDEKERQVNLDLFHERREGSTWLETAKSARAALMIDYQRKMIAARIEDTEKTSGPAFFRLQNSPSYGRPCCIPCG